MMKISPRALKTMNNVTRLVRNFKLHFSDHGACHFERSFLELCSLSLYLVYLENKHTLKNLIIK